MFAPSATGAGAAGLFAAAPLAAGPRAPRAAPAGGIRPLLAQAAPGPARPVVVPLDAYRRRARELWARFAEGGDRAGRLAELRRQLAELLEDLRSVGAPDGELRPLDELLAEMDHVDGGAEALARLWQRAVDRLDAFAGGAGAPAGGRAAGEFWKRPPR